MGLVPEFGIDLEGFPVTEDPPPGLERLAPALIRVPLGLAAREPSLARRWCPALGAELLVVIPVTLTEIDASLEGAHPRVRDAVWGLEVTGGCDDPHLTAYCQRFPDALMGTDLTRVPPGEHPFDFFIFSLTDKLPRIPTGPDGPGVRVGVVAPPLGGLPSLLAAIVRASRSFLDLVLIPWKLEAGRTPMSGYPPLERMADLHGRPLLPVTIEGSGDLVVMAATCETGGALWLSNPGETARRIRLEELPFASPLPCWRFAKDPSTAGTPGSLEPESRVPSVAHLELEPGETLLIAPIPD